MKFTALLLGLVFASTALAQNIQGNNAFLANRAQLFQTYTNFTATSDDTTDNVVSFTIDPLIKSDVLLAREVRLLGRATDSCNADVYVIGTHGDLTTTTQSIADSIINLPNEANPDTVRVITLKGPGVDRLPGYTRIKVGTVFRATGNGTTTGRFLKWYLQIVR